MCFWEEFKRQASEDYLQASEEYAFATEFDSKEEVATIEIVLKERSRVLETICNIDKNETIDKLLDSSNRKVNTSK